MKDTMERLAWGRLLVLPVFLLTNIFMLWLYIRGREPESFSIVISLFVFVACFGGSGISMRGVKDKDSYTMIDDERDRVVAATARQWALLSLCVLLTLSIILFEWPVVTSRLPMDNMQNWISAYLFLLLTFSLWIEALVCVVLYRRDSKASS